MRDERSVRRSEGRGEEAFGLSSSQRIDFVVGGSLWKDDFDDESMMGGYSGSISPSSSTSGVAEVRVVWVGVLTQK